jgi:hypothetical protein
MTLFTINPRERIGVNRSDIAPSSVIAGSPERVISLVQHKITLSGDEIVSVRHAGATC